MGYIALYRQWRPSSFADVVGQKQVTETLKKAIRTDKVAHAYLFSGPRGTGKTSTARIFAKALNCPHVVEEEPCNCCAVCEHISSGESLDVTEVDAASNRSIEDIRNLRETVKFMPVEGKKKIFIIDEVHMLTMEAFNALLKTLEEPPAHVVFILATTEPTKIPMTILSRCQRFAFHRITIQDIAERLLVVAKGSGLALTPEAARLLAIQSDGGMRDALSLLDQCAGMMQGVIDEEGVRSLLGLVGCEWLLSFADGIIQNQPAVVLQALHQVLEQGKEPTQVLMELLEHLRALMLVKTMADSDMLASYSDCMEKLKAQGQAIEAPRLYAMMGILQEALMTARVSPMPRVAVEAGLLTAANTQGQGSLDDLARRIQRLEEQAYSVPQEVLDRLSAVELAVSKGAVGPLSGGPAVRESAAIQGKAAVLNRDVGIAPSSSGSGRMRDFITPPMRKEVVKKPVMHKEEPIVPVDSTSSVGTSKVPLVACEDGSICVEPKLYGNLWTRVITMIKEQKKAVVASCMTQGQLVYVGDGRCIVTFKAPFMAERASKVDYRRYVEHAIGILTGQSYQMKALLAGDSEATMYVERAGHTKPLGERKEGKESSSESEEGEAVKKSSVLSVQERENGDFSGKVVRLEDLSPDAEETKSIKKLIETVGNCTIYEENV